MYKLQKNLGMYLSSLILIIFTIIFLIKGNFEFITYTISIGFLIFIIIKTDKKFNYPQIAKFGFAIWLLLNFLGGSLKINGIRLYDTILIPIFSEPLNIFRYDQLLHTFCYFVFVFFVYSVVKNSLKENISKGMTLFIIVLIAEGIGAINEIIELSTVIFFHTQGVGNYYNNALDLVFNLIGAMLGSIIILNTNKE